MLKDHISGQLLDSLGYQPTSGQKELMEYIPSFIMEPEKKEILLLKGFAGTGKTTSMKALVYVLEKLKIKYVLLAPTGRAAKVLSELTGGRAAYTIHKKIYHQKSSKDGFGTFVLDRNLSSQTFFIVDEASMISNSSFEKSVFGQGKLLDDLLGYVYSGRQCKLVLIGDTAQLPPVGKDLSPALNADELQAKSFSVKEFFFREVVRQEKSSGILFNATILRKKLEENVADLPRFHVHNYKDIHLLPGDELLDTLSDHYHRDGLEETMVVVRSNKQANRYNQGIRNQILWLEEQISSGDLMMVVKNNYYWSDDFYNVDFIANGDVFELLQIHGYEERYGYHFADVTIRLIDHEQSEMDVKIMLDTLNIENASLPPGKLKELFYTIAENYKEEPVKKKRFEAIREDEFFNALQVKFAYAVTCHKAQGGQWKNVFIDPGYFVEDMMNREYLRWLYTAFTRATGNLYLVNFNRFFFSDMYD